jgi:integrase
VKQAQHGRGTVRAVKNKAGEVIGHQAILPRDLSSPPLHKKVGARYRERLGPPQPTADLARSLLDAAIVELRDKRTLRHGLTVSAHADAELLSRLQDARRKYKDDARAARHVATWRSINRLWLSKAAWYDFPPKAVDRADVQRFINWLRDQDGVSGDPLSSPFVRNVAQYVRAVFDRAGADPNPATDLDLPSKDDPNVRFLPIDEQIVLLRSTLPLEDRVMIGCGMGAGLRVGELLSFESIDVHLDREDPHLMVRYGGPKHAPTKGGSARRVELFEPGLGFWRLWMDRFWTGSTMVFPGPRGGYLKAWPEQFPAWTKLTRTRLTSHIMRHTYAVSMLSGTWGYAPRSIEFVSQQLGHSDIQTTQRYYAAFEAGTWKREVEIMTGRARPDAAARDVVTARALLGLGALNGADPDTEGGNSGGSVVQGVLPRYSPPSRNSQENQEDESAAGAKPHHPSKLVGLAYELLQKAEAGDASAFVLADRLAAAVEATDAVRLARAVAAGGAHKIARAIELASLIVNEELDDLTGLVVGRSA